MTSESPKLSTSPNSSWKIHELLSVANGQELSTYLSGLTPIEQETQKSKLVHALNTDKELQDYKLTGDQNLINDKVNEILKNLVSLQTGQEKVQTLQVVEQKGQVVEQKGQVVEQTGQIRVQKGQVGEQTGQIRVQKGQVVEQKGQVDIKAGIETADSLKSAERALDAKILGLTGRSGKDLIPDYSTKVAAAERELRSTGKDPTLATGMVLLASETEIIRAIPPEKRAGIPDLQKQFAEFRKSSESLGLPSRSPASIALVEPKVTLEVYQKVRSGFEPPTTPVYLRNGELQSQSSLGPNRTFMNLETGKRDREQGGLRIPSNVPDPSPDSQQTQAKITDKQSEKAQLLSRAPSYLNGVATLLERVDPTVQTPQFLALRQSLTTPNTQVSSAQAAGLIEQYACSREFSTLPEAIRKHFLASDGPVAGYIKTLKTAEAREQDIDNLRKELPDREVKDRIWDQDQAVDANLGMLVRLGFSKLGQGSDIQTNYQNILTELNITRRNTNASGNIIDTQRFSENTGTVEQLKRVIGALLPEQYQAEYTSSGSLSPSAAASLQLRGVISTDEIKAAASKALSGATETK